MYLFQGEFGSVTRDLAAANESQRQLQRQVDSLQCERDILLEELERSGLVNASVRFDLIPSSHSPFSFPSSPTPYKPSFTHIPATIGIDLKQWAL